MSRIDLSAPAHEEAEPPPNEDADALGGVYHGLLTRYARTFSPAEARRVAFRSLWGAKTRFCLPIGLFRSSIRILAPVGFVNSIFLQIR